MREPRTRVPTRDGLRQTAVLWTGGVRLGLWVLPLPWLRRAVEAAADLPSGRPRATCSAAEVGAAVEAAKRAVPRAGCLVLALAAWGMLRRQGRRPELRLGVTDASPRSFLAHAWVECDGRVVVGGDVSEQVVLGTLPLGGHVATEGPTDA